MRSTTIHSWHVGALTGAQIHNLSAKCPNPDSSSGGQLRPGWLRRTLPAGKLAGGMKQSLTRVVTSDINKLRTSPPIQPASLPAHQMKFTTPNADRLVDSAMGFRFGDKALTPAER